MPSDQRHSDSSSSSLLKGSNIGKIFPLLNDLKNYQKSTFLADLNAGVLVAILLVPQAMAYAVLAGMPAIYGLYGAMLPLCIYAFLGSSRHLSIGPVAISSLLIFAGISQIAVPGSAAYIGLVITCGLLVGMLQFLLGFTRMGFLANFLSYPVITGFTAAAGIIIFFSQLPVFFGVSTPTDLSFSESSWYFLQHLAQFNPYALGLGMGAFLLMLALHRWLPKLPAALLAVVLSTAICYWGQLYDQGVAIIGTIPQGLPAFSWPAISLSTLGQLAPTVFTLTIIGLVECISIGKRISEQQGNYEINPNQELMAIGMAKIGGSFFLALPSSGSFSRSAINQRTGAFTQVSSLVAALLVLLSLLLLTPLFYYLPKAILAAIIIFSIRNLLVISEIRHLWHTDRSDFWMLMITFATTLTLGIEIGVLTGVVLSFGMILYHISKPHMVVLGRVPGKTYYRNVNRFDEVLKLEDHLIIRLDQQLYFGNVDYFKARSRKLIKQHAANLKNVFLDAKGINAVDSSGLRSLLDIQRDLQANGIRLYICNPIGPVRDIIHRHNAHSPSEQQLELSLFLHDAVEEAS